MVSRALSIFCRALLIFSRAFSIFCRALLIFSRALSIFCRALLIFSRALSIFCRSLLIFCRALLIFCRALLIFSVSFDGLYDLFMSLLMAFGFFFGQRTWSGSRKCMWGSFDELQGSFDIL